MLVDPITVAAAAPTPALNFAVVSFDGQGMGSIRKDVVNNYGLTIKHTQNANTGERHYMQLTQQLSAVNPLTGGTSIQTASASLSVSIPAFGWTAATKDALVKALTDTLADSDVTISKFNQFQS
jgi:hypothetical protein